MVAYLKKPTGSEGFQEIVDFLNGSHLRFALTKDPTIYVSLIEKFWQTATVRTVDNGFSEEHTPLFPSMLAIQAKEGEGSGHPSKPQPPPSTTQPIHGEPIPNVVSSSHQKTQTPRQALNQGISACGSPRCQEATRGSIAQTRSERVPTQPYDSPLPRVNTLGSNEGRLTLITPTHSQEDQPQDQLGVFSATKVFADAAKNVHTYTRRRRAVSTGSGGVSTASRLFSIAEELVSTAGALVPVSTAGKGVMEESEEEQSKRTKLQQEQDRLGHEAAMRLQEELDEEERQRMARVHATAQSFTKE
ncbi:hypothetical protein Tco_1524301 [Tanacetum coccineum]